MDGKQIKHVPSELDMIRNVLDEARDMLHCVADENAEQGSTGRDSFLVMRKIDVLLRRLR